MSLVRLICTASFLLSGLLWNASAVAQDLALTKDCEDGFQRFIHMAQSGQLGEDVTNANVGIVGNRVRVELVRTGAPIKLLLLTPKSSPHTICRYFDVAPGDGATARDVGRVGAALDEVFGADPFRLPGLEESLGGDPIPSLAGAWAYGTWRGVLRVVERRMMVLASLTYTAGVIVVLALACLASLALLWGSLPPHMIAKSDRS